MRDSQNKQRRARIGDALIRFSGGVLAVSSLVKLAHWSKPVAYMSFLGYDSTKMYLIAAMEIGIALIFLRRATRAAGLPLLSAYFGGAIAAHFAAHQLNSSTPIVLFNFHHPYLGGLPAFAVLASAWIGVYLRHPESLWSATQTPAPQLQQAGKSKIQTAA